MVIIARTKSTVKRPAAYYKSYESEILLLLKFLTIHGMKFYLLRRRIFMITKVSYIEIR
jgi:hypothetical protein